MSTAPPEEEIDTSTRTILVTGSTDGIGLGTATRLAELGHTVLLHGRSAEKLDAAERTVGAGGAGGAGRVESFAADLADLDAVEALAAAVAERHPRLDVLINNAGVYKAPSARTPAGLDVRFVVNTFAAYLLARRLLPLIGGDGRIVNLSSAAQAPVSVEALAGRVALSDGEAYAQSKLALTMWSRAMADALGADGPVVVAVNPGSLLGTKMVAEAFGSARADLSVGAEILVRAALSDEFADAAGRYFDNDAGRFRAPHPHALDATEVERVVGAIEAVLAEQGRAV